MIFIINCRHYLAANIYLLVTLINCVYKIDAWSACSIAMHDHAFILILDAHAHI